MKLIFITITITLTLLCVNLFAQDTSVTWIRNIDTTAFKLYYNKKYIPKSYRKYAGISKLKDVANPGQEYSAGCVMQNNAPHRRVNWIAKDNKKHCIICIASGGFIRNYMNYYYIDKDNKKS